jgi:hypothetical protein
MPSDFTMSARLEPTTWKASDATETRSFRRSPWLGARKNAGEILVGQGCGIRVEKVKPAPRLREYEVTAPGAGRQVVWGQPWS